MKRERKKLRRQNRREAFKEQEKILDPPLELKLRISNLIRIRYTSCIRSYENRSTHPITNS